VHFAYASITLITAVLTGAIALPDFVPAKFVLANSAEVGVPRSWLTALGAAKLAGAIGLVVGLLVMPGLGIAAAVGAVLAHIRAGVFYNIAFPGAYLCLSTATLTLMVAHEAFS
jgi:hypothetical protein